MELESGCEALVMVIFLCEVMSLSGGRSASYCTVGVTGSRSRC